MWRTARSWPTMRCDSSCSNSSARRPFCFGLRRTVSVKSVCLFISAAIMTVLRLLVGFVAVKTIGFPVGYLLECEVMVFGVYVMLLEIDVIALRTNESERASVVVIRRS